MKISIIVPVFNSEQYIEECVSSLLENDLNDIEIILVNDGSTDNTASILNGLNHPAIKVIHTENRGQSSARNTGVNASSGQYILFVDSDDKLDTQAVDRLVYLIESKDVDVVFFESSVFFDDSQLAERFNPRYERHNSLKDITCSGTEFFAQAINISNYIVNTYLYIASKKAMLGIYFKEGVIHEDNIYTTRLLLENDITVHCVKEKLYARRIRDFSIMTQKKGDNHLNGYYACLMELINRPPSNAVKVNDEYTKFVSHMVDCFKYTNLNIIDDLKADILAAEVEKQALTTALAEAKKEAHSLRTSTSWKVTAPLRKIVSLFQRG